MARPQVPSLPGAPQVDPVAQPVNTFFQPRLAAPVLQDVIDLSPLSSTLARIADAQQQKRAQQDLEAGRGADLGPAGVAVQAELAQAHAGLTSAEEKRKASQETYAKLVRTGKIPESWSPWTFVGWTETAARKLVSQYDRALSLRIADVSTVVDPQTGQPKNPDSAAKVMQEEWAKIADNGILQDFYGSRVAQDARQQIDERFQKQAAERMGVEVVKARETEVQNELGRILVNATTQDNPDWKMIGADWSLYAKNNMVLKSMADPRGTMLSAAKYAASVVADTDAGEAVRLLRHVQDLSAGTTTLGKDTDTGLEINRLIDFYQNQKDTDDDRHFAEEGRRIQHDVRDAQREWGPALDEVEKSGGSMGAYLEQYSQQIKDHPNKAFILERLRENIHNRESEPIEDKAAIGALELRLRRGQGLDTADSEIDSLIASHSMSASTGSRLHAVAEQAGNVAPLLDAAGFANAASSLRQANRATGLPPAVQGPRDQEFEEKLAGFDQSVMEEAQALNGQPGGEAALRKFIQEKSSAVRADLNKSELDLQTKSTAAKQEIEASINSFQDAGPLIKKYGDFLTDAERREYTAYSRSATNKERVLTFDAYKDAEREVNAAIGVALGNDAEKLNSPDGLRLQANFARRLKSAAFAKWTELAKTTPPDGIIDAFQSAMPEVSAAIFKEISGQDVKAITEKIDAGVGKSATDVLHAEADYDASKRTYAGLATLSSADTARALTAHPNPVLSPKFVEVQQRFMSGNPAGFWDTVGSPTVPQRVSRDELETATVSEAFSILKNPKLDDAAKAQALVDAYGPIGGLSAEDVISGQAHVLTPGARENMAALITRDRPPTEGNTFSWSSLWGPRKLASEWLKDQETHTIPIDGAKIDPFVHSFFRNEPELDKWLDSRPADLAALAKRLGVAAEDRGLFINAQRLALRRTNHAE